jgi:hypothetical protein
MTAGAWNALRWAFAGAALVVLVLELAGAGFDYSWLAVLALVALSVLAGIPAGRGPGAYWKDRARGNGR